MAQLHINATVTKDSPVVYLPGDQRAELKIGDYFKLVGIAGVYEIGAISLIGTDTQIQLTAPFLGESGNYPALIHRDFSPEQGYPLIYAGDLDIPDLLRRWALQADSAPAAAVAAHVSAADPHPQYTTAAEAAAAAPVQSVNGKDGTVVLTAEDVGADPAGTAVETVAQAMGDGPAHLSPNSEFGTAAFVDWEQFEAYLKAKYGLTQV